MMQLFQVHAIDQQSLLEEFKIPKRAEIMQRMKMGPLQESLAKLKMTGLFDDPTIMSIEQILTLDDNQFRKAFPNASNPYEQVA